MSYNQQYIQMPTHGGQVVHQQQLQVTAQQAQIQSAQLEMGGGVAAAAANTNAMANRRPFDPTAHDLDANFRLTRFADLKG